MITLLFEQDFVQKSFHEIFASSQTDEFLRFR